MHDVLNIGRRVTVIPVVNGCGDFAVEVRRMMLEEDFDCLAIPLPPSFQSDVEKGVSNLPTPSVVTQSTRLFGGEYEFGEAKKEEDSEVDGSITYVPIDPCQPVIAAIRGAMGEHIPRHFIDLDLPDFDSYTTTFPDAFALKRVPIHKFAAAILPTIQRPESDQRWNRIWHMASQLRELSIEYSKILFVCPILDWPWVRQAYFETDNPKPQHQSVADTAHFSVEEDSLYFMLGELPYITKLYEQARAELESDDNLAIDGVKELLIASRESYRLEFKDRARKISPFHLMTCLKYIRNLELIEGRFTPQLSTIVTAAQQILGDQFALHVLETAKEYLDCQDFELEEARMGIGQAALPNGDLVDAVSRLPGPPLVWRSLQIRPRPDEKEREKWSQEWNPFGQCSWPPEDELIENFRETVFDRANQVMGADLAKTEKFTTSVKDGIDIRDTLRHWYDGEIYVKELPPTKGQLDCCVMLFDSPADPRDYPWRTTWYAEHENESTLSFFATNFGETPIGPGICLATYGGAMFLFPPRSIPDVWSDRRLDFTETLEERLLAAACIHSQNSSIALLSSAPPGAGWRRLAKRFGKTWVHLPMSQFSDSTVQQLRYVHVLNGHQVRSYASDFIRKA